MWEAIPTILDAFENDEEIKVIVLKGAGAKSFVSGADISEFETVRSTKEATNHYEDIADGATDRLYDCPKPTIAMIRGYCIGGGAGIAVSCDLRGRNRGIPVRNSGSQAQCRLPSRWNTQTG
ncbi:MAG: hypothetical protein Ct9H300mP16_01420 [Pseudomonadota bacterium]|nr:MAG: hypothetical protein Ct9H300mP16_01420 [Pseudomonadota bacterium]